MTYTTLSPEEIRVQVYQEVKKQFLKRGIANTEMKQIAQTIGIGRTTLYRYFPQKEQLAFMVALELIEDFLYERLAMGIDPEQNGYEKLRVFCDRFIETVLDKPEVLAFFSEFDSMFMTYPLIPEAEVYEQRMSSNNEKVAQFVIDGQRDGSIRCEEDPITFAAILINTIMGLGQRTLRRTQRYEKEQYISSQNIIRETTKLLLKAIRA